MVNKNIYKVVANASTNSSYISASQQLPVRPSAHPAASEPGFRPSSLLRLERRRSAFNPAGVSL